MSSLLDKMKKKADVKEEKVEEPLEEILEEVVEEAKKNPPKKKLGLKTASKKKPAPKAKPLINLKTGKESKIQLKPEPKKEEKKEAPKKTPGKVTKKLKPTINLKAKATAAAKATIRSNIQSKVVQVVDGSTWIIGLIGKYGTGKTKRAMDTEILLNNEERMLFLDPEAKADKMKAIWHPEASIDIRNFLRYNPETYDTMEIETIDQLREMFLTEWKPLLESKEYKILVMDKINVLWPFCVDYWLKLHPGRKKPLPTDYGEVYGIALKKIFYPIINCCRANGVNIIFCADIKGDYRHNEEIGKKPALHEILLGQMDYMFWLEWDYEVYCIKNIIKPFWTVRDENVNFADYFMNKDFLLNDKEVSGIYVEYKSYNDFMEDTLLSTVKRVEKKKTLNLLKENE